MTRPLYLGTSDAGTEWSAVIDPTTDTPELLAHYVSALRIARGNADDLAALIISAAPARSLDRLSRAIAERWAELEADALETMPDVPDTFPVRPLDDDEHPPRAAECGDCGRRWDDGIPTAYTPTPSARCPFENYHPEATR